jgi:hypothetical protein
LLDKLTRGGGSDMLDLSGHPPPKLVIACAVTALHLTCLERVPGERDSHAIALCAALLVWAAELADVPLPKGPDARRTQWGHWLRQARASVLKVDPSGADPLSSAWGVVQTALQPIADQVSFNRTGSCGFRDL